MESQETVLRFQLKSRHGHVEAAGCVRPLLGFYTISYTCSGCRRYRKWNQVYSSR